VGTPIQVLSLYEAKEAVENPIPDKFPPPDFQVVFSTINRPLTLFLLFQR
jgi:hypothetical protein